MLLLCFKAYDIRGISPDPLNENIAYAVERSFVNVMNARNIAVGYDARLPCASGWGLRRPASACAARKHSIMRPPNRVLMADS